MPPGTHVHIISAGVSIHTLYPAIFRMLPTISRTYVLADSDDYALSSNPEIEKQRLAVRHAVDAVKEISASLSIPFSRELVFAPVYLSVRTVLTKIHRENPGSRFTFDLSGGSKALCMALFAFAPWLGGEVYASFDEKAARRVPLPDNAVSTLLSNPNYQIILAILIMRRDMKKEAARGAVPTVWVPRQYLSSGSGRLMSRPGQRRQNPVILPSRSYSIRRAGSRPQNCLTRPSPGLWGPSAMPDLLRRNTHRATGKRKPTGLLKPGKPRSGSFPILLPARGSGTCWRVPEQDPVSRFCSFLVHIFVAQFSFFVLFFKIFFGRIAPKNF